MQNNTGSSRNIYYSGTQNANNRDHQNPFKTNSNINDEPGANQHVIHKITRELSIDDFQDNSSTISTEFENDIYPESQGPTCSANVAPLVMKISQSQHQLAHIPVQHYFSTKRAKNFQIQRSQSVLDSVSKGLGIRKVSG